MISLWFFGTPSLAASVLTSLLADPAFDVRFVVSQPDKPVGRHQELAPTPVKEIALASHLPIFQPEKIKNNTEFFDAIRAFDVDYFVVVAYGRIIPLALLEMPRKMCVNVHGSILPKYRGASPIQSCLMAGDDVTGVTIMRMSEGMDEGDIISILEIPIDPFETSGTLFEKFGEVSGAFLATSLKNLDNGSLKPYPQDHNRATHCAKIEKSMGQLDLSRPAEELFWLWKGLTPWPGISTTYEGKRLVIERCDYLPEVVEWSVGEVIRIRGRVAIQCGDWVLFLEQVKLEGKKSMDIKSFCNGQPGFVGSVVGG